VVGEAVEQRRSHFRIAEHAGPFAEAEVCGDDDACAFIELAQQVEQQGSTGGAERGGRLLRNRHEIAKLVQSDEVAVGKPASDLAGLALVLFSFEGVDEFNRGEEPDLAAMVLDGLDADGGGEMGFPS
jgi:hypothetical protein